MHVSCEDIRLCIAAACVRPWMMMMILLVVVCMQEMQAELEETRAEMKRQSCDIEQLTVDNERLRGKLKAAQGLHTLTHTHTHTQTGVGRNTANRSEASHLHRQRMHLCGPGNVAPTSNVQQLDFRPHRSTT